jgi:DNA processing protein
MTRQLVATDPQYPSALSVAGAPDLWLRGRLPDVPLLAVVGTRQPTAFGLSVTRHLVEHAHARGWGVVSGLAIGVDEAAHEHALEVGAPTWAVLGSGVEVPSGASHLADAVASSGGLLSEVDPHAAPTAQALVARNRLIAALARVVVVAECALVSGTMHTARAALSYGRPLVAPLPPAHKRGEFSTGLEAIAGPLDPSALKLSKALTARLVAQGRTRAADLVLTDLSDLGALFELEPRTDPEELKLF